MDNHVIRNNNDSHEVLPPPPSLTDLNEVNTNTSCLDQDPSSQGLLNKKDHAPSLTKTKGRVINESGSSSDCILIPEHVVTDDIRLKFILHPNLSSNLTSKTSLPSSINSNRAVAKKPKSIKLGIKNESTSGTDSPISVSEPVTQPKVKTTGTNVTASSKSLATPTSSNPPSGEQFVIKTAKEILYDIAKGKWNRKGMVYDEENEGTKKFGSSKPCSNANCVRAAERERRQRDNVYFEDIKQSETIFEDGNLPSYHSLLNLWKYQEEQKQRYTWLRDVFKHGFPQNEAEFLKVWRECRKNPKAFGIQVSEPAELPEKKVHEGSRVRKVVKPYDRNQLVAEFLEKQKSKRTLPIRLAGREYYNPDWKPVKNMREREKLKKRYDEFRKLYPHLPVLRDVDYRMNPLTVKHRMKQAEEWHKLVTASSKPLPMLESAHYATDIKTEEEAESPPGTAETSELDFSTCSRTGIQRFATSAASSVDATERNSYP